MKRPNILFIMADQMAAPILPLHDATSPVQMPNLMKLAEQAVVFDSAYCNSPLCAPSRCGAGLLITGRQCQAPRISPTMTNCTMW